MARLIFTNVGISAVAACVPKNISNNLDLSSYLPIEEVEKIINNIGIKEKRFVDENVTPSDLCFKAANQLLEENDIDRSSIDILIFFSQSPDHRIPATSPYLQNKLGLPTSTACFDMSLACSGYVYALSSAFAYASMPGVNRVLLLVGETFSKFVSKQDKVNLPLYGDAGTATLIEKGDYGQSFFTLFTDGSGQDAIKIFAGGARCPSTAETITKKEREDGNIRSDHDVFMDGLDVFNFTLKVVPSSVKEALVNAELEQTAIDYFIFHQANKFMIDFFAKKLKIDSSKVPISLDTFGNVSSATIPLTIVSRLKNALKENKKKVLLSGFGAGLSWGTSILNLNNCSITDLIEY